MGPGDGRDAPRVRRAALTRSFTHVAVADWSGEAVARPKGLALAHAPPGYGAPYLLGTGERWSRQAILDWIAGHADAGTDLLIGLDLSPALPFVDAGAYFPGWVETPADAVALWRLIDERCAADPHLGVATFLRDAEVARHFRQQHGCGDRFPGGRGRLRECEKRQRPMGLMPSSCFNLIGAAQVGKSSLTGMRMLHALRGRVPVWPFDPVPATGPVIVEIYTALASLAAGRPRGGKVRDGDTLDAALAALGVAPHRRLPRYDDHMTDAILTAAWLRRAAADPGLWAPAAMTPRIAATEGWTFGVA